jgi:hypothetical protein
VWLLIRVLWWAALCCSVAAFVCLRLRFSFSSGGEVDDDDLDWSEASDSSSDSDSSGSEEEEGLTTSLKRAKKARTRAQRAARKAQKAAQRAVRTGDRAHEEMLVHAQEMAAQQLRRADNEEEASASSARGNYINTMHDTHQLR